MSDKKSHSDENRHTFDREEKRLSPRGALSFEQKTTHLLIISSADEKLIYCIYECVFNTLKGNVSLERCKKIG